MARFQTTFKKTIYTLIAIGLLIGLGTWQMERRAWKTQLMTNMEERGKMPVLNQLPAKPDFKELEFRRVALTGLIDDSKIIFLGPRTQDGKSGYHMYVPMTLPDRRAVLLNQGFISNQYLNMVKPTRAVIQAVSGVLRMPSAPGLFTPKNSDTGNTFFSLDMPTIAARQGIANLQPIVVELDQIAASKYSLGAATREPLTNNHLQYALFWYAMAGIAAIYYLMTSFRSSGGAIEAGFRMRNPNLEQGLPFGAQNGTRPKSKPGKDSNDPPSLW